MNETLYQTPCATCGEGKAVAWIPENDPRGGPLSRLVINPVCRRCLRDYLELLEMASEAAE